MTHASPSEVALARFDALPPVEPGELHGTWRGACHPTGHPLDGLLGALGWHGKRFDGPEHVHPLVFDTWAGRVGLRPAPALAAARCVLRWPALNAPPLARTGRLLLPLLATRRSQARLRKTVHRGVATATLVYDTIPVLDVFRRLDADRVLGLMDLKGLAQPFFFELHRSQPSSP